MTHKTAPTEDAAHVAREAAAEELAADLARHGYREVPEASGYRRGQRVRHRGQQYVQALLGTATITHVMQASPSDVELVVIRDQPLMRGMSRVTQWADYSTRPTASNPADRESERHAAVRAQEER